jgi:hypothetical protein
MSTFDPDERFALPDDTDPDDVLGRLLESHRTEEISEPEDEEPEP